tara:strand:+ start:7860 stop:9074 length:1215 start_codon:yes stop_codon:yes gene_type:complete
MKSKNFNLYYLFPLLLVIYESAAYLSNDMYLPALPDVIRDLSTTDYGGRLTLTLWFVGSASIQLILGPLSDKYGRKPILVISGLIYFITNIVCAITGNIYLFLAMRIIQGMVVCAVIVAGYAAIHELLDQKRAIYTIALMANITILAPALGPVIGVGFIELSSWRLIFWFIAGLTVVSVGLLAYIMPESLDKSKKTDISFKKLLPDYISLLRNNKFLICTIIPCFNLTVIIAWLVAGPFIIEDLYHSTTYFAIYQLIIFSFYIVGAQVVKTLINKNGIEKTLNFGCNVIFISGMSALATNLFFNNSIYGLILSLSIFGFGSALSFSSLQRLAVDSCTEPMGMRMAIFSLFMSIFCVISSLYASNFNKGSLGFLLYLIIFVAFSANFLNKIRKNLFYSVNNEQCA